MVIVVRLSKLCGGLRNVPRQKWHVNVADSQEKYVMNRKLTWLAQRAAGHSD